MNGFRNGSRIQSKLKALCGVGAAAAGLALMVGISIGASGVASGGNPSAISQGVSMDAGQQTSPRTLGAILAGIVQPTAVYAATDNASVAFYTEQVVPVFKANCYRCHAGLAHRGGFQMDTKAGMFKGGHDGVVVIAGDPDKSLLVRLMKHEGPADDPMPMPPHKDKVSDADIAIVAQWIKTGAIMPDDAAKP